MPGNSQELKEQIVLKSNRKAVAAVLAAGLGMAAGQALAVPTLTVSDGTNTVVVTDGGGGDACANLGCVSWTGSVGLWSVNILSGLTKPLLGAPVAPHMDLGFNDVYTGTVPGTLTILWSDTGFSTGPAVFVSDIGGTRASGVTTVAYSDFASASNALNALTTPLCAGSFTTSAFAGSCSSAFAGGAAYSLTQRIVLTATGPGQASGDHGIQIPEPSSLALIGLGLLGLGFAGRRRS
jgi:hypothetical protein